MKLGTHISIAGNLTKSLKRANAVGCEVMQVFTSNPKGWNFNIRPPEEIEEFCRDQKQYGIEKVFGHMIYLVNIASNNPYIYTNSINSLISGLVLGERACFTGVVTHLGSHGGRGVKDGLERAANALKQALKTTSGKVPLLVETDAGSGNHLGATFQEIAEVIKMAEDPSIRVCLDTCHIFAAGYDIKAHLDKVLDEFDRIIGLRNLSLLHLNDSKSVLGSRVDRHAEIGKGEIGIETFKKIINHPALKEIPGILETPDNKDSEFSEKRSLDILKELRN